MAETYYAKPENSPVENLTLNSYDALYIANGGTANSTVINAMGSAVVNDGGSANNTTVNQSGTLHLIGGAATGISVASDGRLEVNKGATATGIEAEKGATLVFDVAASTHIAGTSDGAAFQIQNGIATGFALETGVLTVSSGATAINTTLNSAGTLNISSGGKATGATVSMGGALKIFSSGSAIGATVSMGGKLTVESGGLADAAVVAMGGTLEVVSSSGLATGTVVNGNGALVLSSGGKATGTTVAAGGVLNVGTKGVADGADVNGFLNVLGGGLASNVTLNEGAAAYVQSKGTGSDVDVYDGAFLEILSGGRLKGMTVYAGGSATIHADVIASNVDIDGGEVTVKSDGMAYQTGVSANTIVENEGMLHIEGGALVEGALVSKFACVDVAEDGVLSNATITGATLEVRNGGFVTKLDMKEDAIMYVESGGVLNDIKVSAGAVISGDLSGATGLKFYGGTLDLLIGGRTAEDDFIIDEDSFNSLDTSDSYFLTLSVGEGMEEGTYKLIEKALGFDKPITVKDMFSDGSETIGTLTVGGDAVTYSGFGYTLNLDTAGLTVTATKLPTPDLTGDLDSEAHLTEGMYGSSVNILEGGKLHVSNGGLAEVTAINAGGSMVVSQGGSASDTTVNNGGKLYVSKGGIASKTELNDGGKLFASGSVGGATVSSGGSMFVSSGATASDINVSAGGILWIKNGGTATGIVAANGAELWFDVVPDTYVKGTYAGSAFEMKDATLSDFTVRKDGEVSVRSGGVTSNITTLNEGLLWIYNGGVAKDTVVAGELGLQGAGAVVSGVTFQAGAHFSIYKAGGKLTGKVTFETGAEVYYSDGASATLDFDLTQTTADADALVNDLSHVLAAPFDYTLTVDGTEAAGDYNLAGGATGFDKTITVKNTLGEDLGTLTVGTAATLSDGRDYTLTLSTGGSLGLTLGEGGGTPVDLTGNLTSKYDLEAGKYASSVNILEGGRLNVSNGGFTSQTTVNSGGTLFISEGGIASDTTLNDNGKFRVLGTASKTAIAAGGSMYVHGSADSATVAAGGQLVISSGGKISNITAELDGAMDIESGATATSIVASEGAILGFRVAPDTYVQGTYGGNTFEMKDAALSVFTLMSKGVINILDGGITSDVSVDSDGLLRVYSGGVAKDTLVSAGGELMLRKEGAVASGVTFQAGGHLSIYEAGGKLTGKMTFETGTTVEAETGAILDFDLTQTTPGADALVNDLSFALPLPFSYTLTVEGADTDGKYNLAGGVAKFDKTITVKNILGEDLGTLTVAEGTKKLSDNRDYTLALDASDNLSVTIGETTPTVDLTGNLDSTAHLTAGKYGSSVNILSGGKLYVENGGLASQTTLNYGGRLYVEEAGAVVSQTTITSGGRLYVSNGGVATDVTANSGGSGYIYSGGTATGIVAAEGAFFYIEVAPNTYAKGTYAGNPFEITDTVADYTIQSCWLSVENGGTANNVTVEYGLSVENGGKATGVTVASGGDLTVSSGGTATGIVAADGAMLHFTVAPNTYAQGTYAGNAFEIADTVTGYAIHSGGVLTVDKGGTADAVTVNYGGTLEVANGGTAIQIKENGGYVASYYDDATLTFVPNTFTGLNVNDNNYATVHSGTVAEDTTLDNGKLFVFEGGLATGTIVNADGYLSIDDGGHATGTTVDKHGYIFLQSGGLATGVTVKEEGWLWCPDGGKITGKLTFETGAKVEAVGTTLDFDLTQTTVGADALVNDLSFALATDFAYTLTVQGADTDGKYNLAGNAAGFNKTITVKNILGEDLGTLTVAEGTKKLSDNRDYTLALDASNNLSVTIGEIGGGGEDTTKPVVSNIKADITTQTNGNVTVTADFNDNVEVASRLYNFNGGEWQDYDPAAGVVVTENGTTVNFKAVDTSGNESEGANYYTVTNIDKADPTITNIMASTTLPAESVTVTADFSDNVALASKQYRIGNGEWQDYDPAAGVTVTANVTVFFRAVDTAGNKAEDSCEVNNIVAPDTTPPTITISQDTTGPAASVTVTAVFTDDVAVAAQQYRIGDGEWQDYTSPFTVTENGIISFQASDTSGNSVTESWTVTNIVEEEKGKPDNGWNDYLYDKKLGWNDANIANFADNKVTPEKLLDGNNEIYLDIKGTVVKDGKHNMFGNDGTNKDTGDTAKISVSTPAKLTFSIDSTADGTFYVYEDGKDKKGNRKQIQVGKVAVKKGKTAELKNICLTAGEGKYYVEMVAKNVRKEGAEGFYNVTISNSTFFVDADAQTNNEYQDAAVRELKRGTEGIVFDSAEMNNSPDTKYNSFVGFSDAVDYVKLDLASDSYVSFDLASTGNAKFTLWKYDKAKNKISKITSGCATLKSKNGEVATKTTKAQLLQTIGANGKEYEYYLSMECSDAAKGGAAYYNVTVNAKNTRFFDSADNGDNNVLYIKKDKSYKDDANFQEITLTEADKEKAIILDSNTIGDTRYNNFVGFNDTADYAKIVLKQKGSLSFEISALADVTFEIWQKDKDRKGNNVLNSVMKKTAISVKDYSVGNTGKTTAITLDAGEYYISVTAKKTTANEKGSAFYNVTAFFTAEAVINDSLAMPETDSLAMADELGFGQYGTDALADVSAAASLDAGLDGKSAWLNIASLA